MSSLFLSYSHKDEDIRVELEVHLAMLKRQGVIETWDDRRIAAGDEWDHVIKENLENADIILLLVSPYFLASGYCYDIEVKRALERHEAGSARVIPVVVDPCDWKAAPFAKLATLPKDGKPISKYPNQHDAFLEIVQAIRAVAGQKPAKQGGTAREAAPVAPGRAARGVAEPPRSSNLRLKKEFTDQDRDTFLEDTFEYIAKFFEGSLAELQARNDGITGKFKSINSEHFAATIYRGGKSVSACGIRLGSGFSRSKQIVFSDNPTATNSMNEAVDVADDGHILFLKATGFSRVMGGRGDEKQQLTQQGAAELFWGMLISPLQR
jgi:hypothetical protein